MKKIIAFLLCLLVLSQLLGQLEVHHNEIHYDGSPTIRTEVKNIDELHIKNLWDFTITGRESLKGKIIHQADEHIWLNLEGDTVLRLDNLGQVYKDAPFDYVVTSYLDFVGNDGEGIIYNQIYDNTVHSGFGRPESDDACMRASEKYPLMQL